MYINNFDKMELKLKKYVDRQSEYNIDNINILYIFFFRDYIKYKESCVNSLSKATESLVLKYIDKSNKNFKINFVTESLKYLAQFMLGLILSFGFIFVNCAYRRKKNIYRRLLVVRTPAAISKTKWMNDCKNTTVIAEKLKPGNEFYSFLSFTRIFKYYFLVISRTLFEMKGIREYCREFLSKDIEKNIANYFISKVIYSKVYEVTLEEILSNKGIKYIYTGNNLDRFGIIEERVCKEKKVKLINIPHGIEYGFKVPHCFTGDVFFSYSRKSKDHLNSLYNTKKFRYKKSITSKMLRVESKKHEPYVVFFTEKLGTEINIKIIKLLKELCAREHIKFKVKLHPCDSKVHYNELEINYLDDFAESITNNICISRKSTILIEALYNKSKSIASIISDSDRMDYELFPSLNDDSIKKAYSVYDLECIVVEEIENIKKIQKNISV